MKKLLFSTILLLALVTATQAQNPSTARRIRYGTPPVVCNPNTGDVYIDTTVTPSDFVRCVATNKWERESVGKVNAQTGTTYTFVKADRNKLTTFSNASAVAVTLPQATAAGDFLSGWNVPVFNLGAGTVTITPTTSTINGGATLTLATGEGAWIFSNGTDYSALKTISAAAAGTVTTTGSPASGNLTKFSGATSVTSGDLSGDVTTAGDLVATLAATATTLESRLFCSDAGSTDAYACNLSPAIGAYVTGTHYRFKANSANTGAATINFNALGVKTIKKLNDQDLSDNDIEAGQWVDVVYDGTNMQMQSQIANAAGSGGSTNPTSLFIPYNNAGAFADSRLKQASADVTEVNGGLSAQTFSVYKTDNGSGTYQRLRLFNNSGTFEILSDAAGLGAQNLQFGVSGATPRLLLGSNFLRPTVDRGYDFGDSGLRWNQGFFFKIIINGDGLLFQSGPSLVSGGGGWLQLKDSGGSGNLTRISMGDPGATGVSLTKPASQTYIEARDGNNSNYVPFIAIRFCYSGTTVCDFAGSGSPESVLSASVGSTYRRTDGGSGTTFYVKESGTGNTGWVAK